MTIFTNTNVWGLFVAVFWEVVSQLWVSYCWGTYWLWWRCGLFINVS